MLPDVLEYQLFKCPPQKLKWCYIQKKYVMYKKKIVIFKTKMVLYTKKKEKYTKLNVIYKKKQRYIQKTLHTTTKTWIIYAQR